MSVVSFAAARAMLLRHHAAASNRRTFLFQNIANQSAALGVKPVKLTSDVKQ